MTSRNNATITKSSIRVCGNSVGVGVGLGVMWGVGNGFVGLGVIESVGLRVIEGDCDDVSVDVGTGVNEGDSDDVDVEVRAGVSEGNSDDVDEAEGAGPM